MPQVIQFCMEVDSYRPDVNAYLLKAVWQERIPGTICEQPAKRHAVLLLCLLC